MVSRCSVTSSSPSDLPTSPCSSLIAVLLFMARRRGHTWIVGLRFACSTSSRSVVKAGGHAGWAHVERGLFQGRLRGRVSRQQPNGDWAPEAVQDLVFDAVADART